MREEILLISFWVFVFVLRVQFTLNSNKRMRVYNMHICIQLYADLSMNRNNFTTWKWLFLPLCFSFSVFFFYFIRTFVFGKYAKYLVTTQNIIKLNRLLSRLKMLFLRTIRFSYIHENSSTAPYHLWSIFYSTQQQQHGATYCTQNQERKKNTLALYSPCLPFPLSFLNKQRIQRDKNNINICMRFDYGNASRRYNQNL